MSQVGLLYRFQQTENEVREDKKRLAEVIRLQSENAELIKARKQVDSAESELSHLRVRQTDLSLELDSLSTKAKRSEDRLYSGLVTNPKELKDLQHEIESLGRRLAILEDEFIEAMIAVEESEINHVAAVENLKRVETKWKETTARCKEEQTKLLEHIGEMAAEKNQIAPLIRPQTMIAFEDAKRRAGEVAVAALKNGRCRGCLVTVPANQRKAADEGQMVICDSCGRILCAV
jgi:predicted  nucleic acid-binding Zn-ribbon protein